MAKFKGRKLPLIGRIDISVIEEANPRLLAFEQGALDYIEVPVDLVANVLEPDNTLKPRFTKAGVTLQRGIQPGITYTWFNMEDPVVGGYTKEKVALRRAIGMAYNVDEEAKVIRQGQAEWASQVIPPGVSGPRSQVRRQHQVRSRPARRRCSTASATSTGTRTAGATCPTASRWC